MVKFMHELKCKLCGSAPIESKNKDDPFGPTFWYCSNSRCKNATNPSNKNGNPPDWLEEVPVD